MKPYGASWIPMCYNICKEVRLIKFAVIKRKEGKRMKTLLRKGLGIALGMLLVLSTCSVMAAGPVFPSDEYIPPVNSKIQAKPPVAAVQKTADNQTTVTLLRRLGPHSPVAVETVSCTEDNYLLKVDYRALMEDWGITKSRYVFIGWFFPDEAGEPDKWAGDGSVMLKKGTNTQLIAVFNSRRSSDNGDAVVHTYLQLGTRTPQLTEITPGVTTYPLASGEDIASAHKVSTKRYAFQGWFYADEMGKPLRRVDTDSLTVEKGMDAYVTALFRDLKSSETVIIDEEQIPLAAAPVESVQKPAVNPLTVAAGAAGLLLFGFLIGVWTIKRKLREK